MNKLLSKTKTFLERNSPMILTCVGAAGVIATAVFAVKATPKAVDLLKAKEKEKGDKLTVLETVKVAGPAYIPSVIIGASTIACIFGANALNKKQQASLASAYALLDSSYREYRQSVKNVFGEEGDKQIIEKMASEKKSELTDGKMWFFDDFSLRSFIATMEQVKEAEAYVNMIYKNYGQARISDFYEYLGLLYYGVDQEFGWFNTDGGEIVFKYDIVNDTDDPRGCYCIISQNEADKPDLLY